MVSMTQLTIGRITVTVLSALLIASKPSTRWRSITAGRVHRRPGHRGGTRPARTPSQRPGAPRHVRYCAPTGAATRQSNGRPAVRLDGPCADRPHRHDVETLNPAHPVIGGAVDDRAGLAVRRGRWPSRIGSIAQKPGRPFGHLTTTTNPTSPERQRGTPGRAGAASPPTQPRSANSVRVEGGEFWEVCAPD